MLPTGLWLHLTVGFLLGIISAVFIYTMQRLIKQYSTISKILLRLLIYTSSMMLVVYVYSIGLFGGLLTEWQYLGTPAFADRAVKIIDIGYVEAQSGNRYQFVPTNNSAGSWELVQEMTDTESIYYPYSLPMEECGTLFFLPLPPVRKVVESKAFCEYTGHSTEKIVYVIDKDGEVALWQHNHDSLSQAVTTSLMLLISGVASCFFGIIVILLSAAVSSLLVRRKNDR